MLRAETCATDATGASSALAKGCMRPAGHPDRCSSCVLWLHCRGNPVKAANESSQEGIYLRKNEKNVDFFAETGPSPTPSNDQDARGLSERKPEGNLMPFQPRGRNPASFQYLCIIGEMLFFFPPVKYLIKPHKGANVLLKLMELYKKC